MPGCIVFIFLLWWLLDLCLRELAEIVLVLSPEWTLMYLAWSINERVCLQKRKEREHGTDRLFQPFQICCSEKCMTKQYNRQQIGEIWRSPLPLFCCIKQINKFMKPSYDRKDRLIWRSSLRWTAVNLTMILCIDNTSWILVFTLFFVLALFKQIFLT